MNPNVPKRIDTEIDQKLKLLELLQKRLPSLVKLISVELDLIQNPRIENARKISTHPINLKYGTELKKVIVTSDEPLVHTKPVVLKFAFEVHKLKISPIELFNLILDPEIISILNKNIEKYKDIDPNRLPYDRAIFVFVVLLSLGIDPYYLSNYLLEFDTPSQRYKFKQTPYLNTLQNSEYEILNNGLCFIHYYTFINRNVDFPIISREYDPNNEEFKLSDNDKAVWTIISNLMKREKDNAKFNRRALYPVVLLLSLLVVVSIINDFQKNSQPQPTTIDKVK